MCVWVVFRMCILSERGEKIWKEWPALSEGVDGGTGGFLLARLVVVR